MNALLESLKNLGPLRLAAMAGVALALIGFFVFLTARLSAPNMALLYGDLDAKDSAAIVKRLETEKIPYELRNNGTEIVVPADQVLRQRMAMAEAGLPSGGSVGFEIFDKSEGLGTTNFVQNLNHVRALEGELARTIRSIDGVRAARVHLVMPRRELFSREKQEPSASVVVQTLQNHRIGREQVNAIQHLIAAAVPGLTPPRISIVDDKGNLLARGMDQNQFNAATAEEMRLAYEGRLARSIEQLLERTVGFGSVRAEVTADMDFDRVVTSQEIFDPDGAVVRSTRTTESRANSTDNQESTVTVANNLPDAKTNQAPGQQSTSAENSTEEVTNYEISKTVRSSTRETGVVRRLSVAVIVDGTYKSDGEGNRTWQARSQEEMDKIAAVVRSAAGFDSKRGDTVEVVNMRFASLEDERPAGPQPIFLGMDKNDLMRMAEILVLSIVAILVLLLVVRPLITRAFEALPAAAGGPMDKRLLADQAGQAVLAGPAAPVPSQALQMAPEEPEIEDMIDIDRVEGRVKASSVRKVGEIVDKHPEEALSIIRNWMYQES